jgi:hypothetical protein
MNEEKINKKLIDDLKNLSKVDAPKNFETELWRKINSSEEVKKISFLEKIFTPGKIAPAAIALASAVIIFFVIDITPEQMEDPLTIEPRLREDFHVVAATYNVPVEKEKKSARQKNIVVERSEEVLSQEKGEAQPLTNSMSDDIQTDKKMLNDENPIMNEMIKDQNISDSFKSEETLSLGGTVVPSPKAASSSQISKSNLNFMQRNLSIEEKVEVQQLKMKVQTQESSKTDQK